MATDYFIDPEEILDACLGLRDQYRTPTRLADAMDDPMPVQTGNPTLNSETSRAIQTLTERFDEFGEAIRRDAAGLLQHLQKYGRVDDTIKAEFDEISQALTRRAGADRPVLAAPDPRLPPSAQRQLGLRRWSWEAVEPPVGADCAYRLGEPESIRALGEALVRAAGGLDVVLDAVRFEVNHLVPSGWRGDAATSFKAQMDQQLETVRTEIVERTRKLGAAANFFADYLNDAWVKFAEAQVLARRFDFTLVPQRRHDPMMRDDACQVRRNGPDPQDPQAAQARETAFEQCQILVDRAIAFARGARGPFRAAVAETTQNLSAILRPVGGTRHSGGNTALAIDEAARARVRSDNVLRRIEEELLSAPRTTYGAVGPMPSHLMGADGNPTPEAYSAIHQQIVRRLEVDHPGVRFDVTVTPDGAHLRVVGRAPGVRDPGFDYIQIIPDTPEHMRQYARTQWGTPDFEGRGRIFTYDRGGRIYGLGLSPLF